MDRFLKIFTKSGNKKDEKVSKEEEDVVFESQYNFEIEEIKPNEKLNQIVEGLKIGGVLVDNYKNYNQNLEKLIGQYNSEISELDYRFTKICETDEIMPYVDTSLVEKMKIVGKIGENSSQWDETSINGKIELNYNKFRVFSEKGFSSIKTTNCVYKRKWYYEVQLVTNNLQQIGWCQMNTAFSSTDGVGDDLTSYAYDGYRIVRWHAGKKNYGYLWDVGDVIGCCIDLDDQKMEFFQNGVSLGKLDDLIPIGENIAYFPSISLSQGEKAIFNFGKSPFQYSYPGYEPLDLPECIYNGAIEITIQLVDLLKTHFIHILSQNNNFITSYDQLTLTSKIFNFLVDVSFKDCFTLKTVLLPFLSEISYKNNYEFYILLSHIFLYINTHQEKIQFVNNLFDNICGMIEEFGIKGEKGIEEWKHLIHLLIEILKIDFIAELWIENGKTTSQLKMIFNTNLFKMNDLYNYLKEKYNNFTVDITVFKVFKEIKNEFYQNCMIDKEKIENIYTENLKKIILFFLLDSRSLMNRNKNQNIKTNLKDILAEYVNKGNDFAGQENVIVEVFIQNIQKKDHNPFLKNFVFVLYNILSDYMTLSLNNFGVDLWFKRLNQKNLFYDEIGIGGTISHVTSEFISHIEDSFKEENNTFQSEINNRIIKISTVISLQLKEFGVKLLEKYKRIQLKQFVDFEHGSDHFNNLFRTYFYLYSEKNQIELYKYAFFLIKWINNLVRTNKYLVYFMPKSVYEIPYDIFRFLNKIKANVLKDSELRNEVNKFSPHFINDDFNQEIVFFYTYLFSDQTIANPEIKESLIIKIEYFMKKNTIAKIFETNSDMIQFLIKGLLNYMSNVSLCHIACEIMVKIVKPICFGNKASLYEKNTLVNVTKTFFESDINTFHEFMDNYTKLINKVMTEFTMTLNECSHKVLNLGNNVDSIESKSSLLKKFQFSYCLLCDLMKIFEFLLAAYPNEFFDISTLNYSRFVQFLKNLSSRILEKNYFNQMIKLLEKTKPATNFPGGVESILYMGYSIVGIFLNIDANKENPKFSEFIKKLSNLTDLDMEPFLELHKYVGELNSEQKLNEGIERFKSVIEFFITSTTKKRERTMSTEEWEETNKNENICIICYSNTCDRILLPCKHICCNECLLQYLSDKKYCFICNTPIETTEVFNPESK